MDTLFSTNDKWELLALHRVFIEAKFSEDPNDRDILASPIVCKMYERIFSELKKSEEKWDDWLKGFTERARTVVVSNIEKIQDWEWKKWNEEKKMSYVKDALFPVVIEPSEIEEIVEMGNKYHWC